MAIIMHVLLPMTTSGWIDIKRKITRSQELQNSTTFKLQLTVPDIGLFPLITKINIDILIVGLHFQRKQCDVNNSVITQYIYPRHMLRCDWCSFA